MQTLYDKSPYWLQHVLLNAYAYRVHKERYGKLFNEVYNNLLKSQWYTRDQINQYQETRLKDLVRHAYNTVQFYRDLYDKNGVHPDDINCLEDIKLLPIITREDIRNADDSLLSSNYPKHSLVHGHTSGTTGSPLSFYWDKDTCVYTNAVDWRQKNWAGVHYGERLALFLGRTIVPTKKNKPPFWQYDRIHKTLWMSSFHLGEEYLPYYFKKLREFRPSAIEGYPSTIYILARYLRAAGETFPVKAVFTSSETLLPHQRSLIESQFESPVFDFFGMAERIAFAGQCAEEKKYHLNFEYAINEIVDSNDKVVEEGGQGYLVGTSLLNYGMPFIRYKTTDVTAIEGDSCSCGRSMLKLQNITTKDEDIVVTPEGKLISSSILTHPFKPLDNVYESQIIQESIETLYIKIVPREGYNDADSNNLITAIKERVGPSMHIHVELVDEILREKSGKLRWVISKVPLPL